jgi:MFS transporter, FHS family, glucose/mannose:H+ symporter
MYKKNIVFAAACIGMLLFGIVMISLGTINTYLSVRFNLDEIHIASLAALLPFGILAGSLVFGPIVDRYSYKVLLIVCSVLILISLEILAFAETFALIQAAFFLIGFGGGVINGGTNALVADISAGEQGAKLSLLGVFYGAGALGFPLVTRLLSQSFSYAAIIAGIGIFIVLPILFFIFIKFPLPKQPQGFPIKNAFKLVTETSLLMLSFVLFFQSAIEGITNNWTTRYLEQSGGLSTDNALSALTALALSLTLTRLILGAVLKKIPYYIVMYICLGFVFAGGVVLIGADSLFTAVTAMVLLGIGFAAAFPIVLGYISELYSSLSGTAFSIALFIALMGNTLINYLVGLISQNQGIEVFPYILLLTGGLLFIILSFSLKQISNKIKI